MGKRFSDDGNVDDLRKDIVVGMSKGFFPLHPSKGNKRIFQVRRRLKGE